MGCCQSHSNILTHGQPLTVTLLPLDVAKLRLWSDVLLLRTFLPPPFVSTTLILCYRWREQRVYSGGFRCQLFLPSQVMTGAFLPFTYCLYPSSPLVFWAWPAWPKISLAIPSAKLSVPVHLFLVDNCLQHPLHMHLPSPENWGLPWPITLMLLVHVQPLSAAFFSLEIILCRW